MRGLFITDAPAATVWLAHSSNFVGRLQQPHGRFDILPGFTTIAIFRLVPLINRFLTPYGFPSVAWHSTPYGPKSEPTS